MSSRIVNEVYNDYIRAFNRELKSPTPEARQETEIARKRYAQALAEYVIGGDPSWYDGSTGKRTTA